MIAFTATTYNGPQVAGEHNDCAVRCLMTVTGSTYLAAHTVLADTCGRKFRKGTNTYSLIALLDSGTVLGATFKRLADISRGSKQTLATFARLHPVGSFYCLKASHAFTIVDGVLVDTWKVGGRCRVFGAWAVTPKPAAPTAGPLRANTIAKLVAAHAAAPVVDGAKLITVAHLQAAGLGASWAKTPASLWANSPRHQHALRVWGAASAVCSKGTITVR